MILQILAWCGAFFIGFVVKGQMNHDFALRIEVNPCVIEITIGKAIFYSAFIIRKLIDCKGKVSDEVDKYSFTIKGLQPEKEVNFMNRWPENGNYDWEHEVTYTKPGTDICNWLIHSYVFFFTYDTNEKIDGFYVSSDYDRNKVLYWVALKEWIAYMEFVGKDYVVAVDMHFDNHKKDYIFTKKERSLL